MEHARFARFMARKAEEAVSETQVLDNQNPQILGCAFLGPFMKNCERRTPIHGSAHASEQGRSKFGTLSRPRHGGQHFSKGVCGGPMQSDLNMWPRSGTVQTVSDPWQVLVRLKGLCAAFRSRSSTSLVLPVAFPRTREGREHKQLLPSRGISSNWAPLDGLNGSTTWDLLNPNSHGLSPASLCSSHFARDAQNLYLEHQLLDITVPVN